MNDKQYEELMKQLDSVIKILVMSIMKDLTTDKEKVHFLQHVVGLDSSKIALIMNKTTKELSTYLYNKKLSDKSKSK